MQVFLMEEVEKKNLWKAIFQKIEKREDRVLINEKCNNLSFKQKIKLVKKIQKVLRQNQVNKIVLSKNLKKDKDLVDLFYSNGFDIIDGKILYKLLIKEVLKKICTKNQIKEKEKQISIAVNEINTFTLNLVETLAKEFKVVNVVSSNMNYFKRLKEKLWEENGMIITLTNNKKKACAKSDIILNMDFPQELLNQYTIYENSILINLEEKVKIKKKRFHGKVINDCEIALKKDSNIANALEREEYQNFDLKDLAEIYVTNYPKELQNIIIL